MDHMAEKLLDVVAHYANERDEADRKMREAIVVAWVNGYSTHTIAEVCGMTHEGIRGIIKKSGVRRTN